MLTGGQAEDLPFVGIARLGGEPIGESICFDSAGDGFFTIGETPSGVTSNPLFYYRRVAKGAPPAFSVTVSDGVLSDGPHAATILIGASPMELWRHQFFSAAELEDRRRRSVAVGRARRSRWGRQFEPDRVCPRHPPAGGRCSWDLGRLRPTYANINLSTRPLENRYPLPRRGERRPRGLERARDDPRKQRRGDRDAPRLRPADNRRPQLPAPVRPQRH